MIGYLSPVLYCLSLQCNILCFIIRSEKRRKYPVGGKALAFEEEKRGGGGGEPCKGWVGAVKPVIYTLTRTPALSPQLTQSPPQPPLLVV